MVLRNPLHPLKVPPEKPCSRVKSSKASFLIKTCVLIDLKSDYDKIKIIPIKVHCISMAKLKILQEPDPRLRLPTLRVEHIDGQIQKHLEDMLETMVAHEGLGLAAPQVNLRQRLVVMDTGDGPIKMVNPEIIFQSQDLSITKEGCLSVPDYQSRVSRCARVHVRYWDAAGVLQEREFSGLAATCVQHEIDHLDGILFIDHLSPLQKVLVRKKLQKIAQRMSA